MASAVTGGRFRRREHVINNQRLRVRNPAALTAAATRINLADRTGAARQQKLRQGWQLNAWAYRDSIGELRYALNFLANCAARMRIFPACYPISGESDTPVAISDLDEQVPANVISACGQAMTALGNGRLAISQLMHTLSTNKSVAGECSLLGQTDPETGEDTWSIRSVSEITVKDDKYYLREVPGDAQGINGAEELDPEMTVISRIWTPHPQWRLWADSPMRAIQDDCESLLIQRRTIRASGRSRLAGRGLLLVPSELSIKRPQNDNDDPEAGDFLGDLTEAMLTPLDNEGAASAVVPIVVEGPAEALAELRHIDLAFSYDEMSSKVREELIGVIATALDLPKEIIMGVADLNHWSAWQVDDNTFRHHVEPHVILCCDSLTGAFLRPFLEDAGVDPSWVERLLFWYDPTELVTHPDRTTDAEKAYTDMVISAEARRRESGFSEEDAPTIEELEMRRVMDIRALPLNLLMEYASRADPTLVVPPMAGPPQLPGIKPGGGVDVGAPASTPSVPTGGALPAPKSAEPAPTPPADQPHQGPPSVPGITAAGPERARNDRLSRKLSDVDRDLRTRLQTAANAHMLRHLERAGAKLVSKVAKDETLRTKIAHRPKERAAAIIGEPVLTAAGITAQQLLTGDWTGLQAQFMQWTTVAQKQALTTALKLGGIAATSEAVAEAQQQQATSRDAAWSMLALALNGLSEHLLYNPDPNTPAGEWGDQNPNTLVPAGLIRAALAVAGGTDASAVTVAQDGTATLGGFTGQIGTGQTIGGLLSTAGGTQDQWEWNHASSVIDPFEGHLELDGTEFASFDSEALANPGDWPPNEYFFPGDHQGCTCDAMPLWSFPGSPVNDSSAEGGE